MQGIQLSLLPLRHSLSIPSFRFLFFWGGGGGSGLPWMEGKMPLNAFSAGNLFWGTKLRGVCVGRDFGL